LTSVVLECGKVVHN